MWKAGLLYYIQMECVSQKVSTLAASMPIIYAKVRAPWPLFWVNIGPALRWEQVGDDRYTVLIVISHEALIGVGGIASNYTSALV